MYGSFQHPGVCQGYGTYHLAFSKAYKGESLKLASSVLAISVGLSLDPKIRVLGRASLKTLVGIARFARYSAMTGSVS